MSSSALDWAIHERNKRKRTLKYATHSFVIAVNVVVVEALDEIIDRLEREL